MNEKNIKDRNKFLVDQTLGNLEEDHFEKEKKKPKMYNAVKFGIGTEGCWLNVNEPYFKTPRARALFPENQFRLGPIWIWDPNKGSEVIKNLNDKLESTFVDWSCEISEQLKKKNSLEPDLGKYNYPTKKETKLQKEEWNKNRLRILKEYDKCKSKIAKITKTYDVAVKQHTKEYDSLNPECKSKLIDDENLELPKTDCKIWS